MSSKAQQIKSAVDGGVEDGAAAVADHLDRLLARWRQGPMDREFAEIRLAVLGGAWRRMAAFRDLDSAPLDGGLGHWGTPVGWVEDHLKKWPQRIWADPHGMGWIHEQFAALGRRQSFADHVHGDHRHANATVSTQLYTPRWIADALAKEAFQVVATTQPTVLDPAVGGGQMLLAALAELVAAEPTAEPTAWARCLRGVDLDGRVVDVARHTLALAIGEYHGARDAPAEALLIDQIEAGDSLRLQDISTAQIVLTNPPYMGWRSMPDELRELLDRQYRPFHRDLFAAFIARCHELATGCVGILAQQSIWYLRRFEKARRQLLNAGQISLFLHLGARAFWNLSGEKASVVAFVQQSSAKSDLLAQASGEPGDLDRRSPEPTTVWDLRELKGPQAKRRAFKGGDEIYRSRLAVDSLAALPGLPFFHDLSPALRDLFSSQPPLAEVAEIPGGQNKTGRNKRFVRPWSDVPAEDLRRVADLGDRGHSQGRWVFYSKGGRFAPWWGNWDYVVDWNDEARQFYAENRTSNLLDESLWFRQGIVYTDFGGKRFNARWMPPGCVFDMTGPAIFPRPQWWPDLSERQRLGAALAVLNSSPARRMLRALNPTLHFQVRNVRALPVPTIDENLAAKIAEKVWQIIDGLRRLHGAVVGDPLANIVDEPDERPGFIARLQALEVAIDQQVCGAYGVDYDPIDNASVADHHRL